MDIGGKFREGGGRDFEGKLWREREGVVMRGNGKPSHEGREREIVGEGSPELGEEIFGE